MVLCLKTRESRSSPGLQRTDHGRQRTENGKRKTDESPLRSRPASSSKILFTNNAPRPSRGRQNLFGSPDRKTENSFLRSPSSVLRPPIDAGWSSPVARQAHNLKAAGSNPAPATNVTCRPLGPKGRGVFLSVSASIPASSPTSSIASAPFSGTSRIASIIERSVSAVHASKAAMQHRRAPTSSRERRGNRQLGLGQLQNSSFAEAYGP